MKNYVIYEEYGKLDKRHQEFLTSHLEVWDKLYSNLDECINTVNEYSNNIFEEKGFKVLSSKWHEDRNELDLYLGYSKMIKLHIKEFDPM